MQSYSVWWSDEDQAWLATESGLPAGTIHGETPEAALRNAIEVADEWRDAGFTAAGAHEPWAPDAVRALRRSLDLSQQEFAALLNVAVATVRGWEQGQRRPAGPSVRLLDMVAAAPGIARKWGPSLTEHAALTMAYGRITVACVVVMSAIRPTGAMSANPPDGHADCRGHLPP